MDPLFKAMIFRTFAFLLWSSLSAWLFAMVEYTEKDETEEKEQLLLSLYKTMPFKYNMTEVDFKNFSSSSFEALSKPNPRWTFFTALIFVTQAMTTIGKLKHEMCLSYNKMSFLKKFIREIIRI